jgi:uncharacterized protein YggE
MNPTLPSCAAASPLSLLTISEEASSEVTPIAVDIHVVLTADRFFSGRAALEKAEELRRLVIGLGAAGLPEDAVSLEGASLDVSSGIFAKSSSVTYRVKVHLLDMDRLGDVLDAVAACRKASLSHLVWVYPRSAPLTLVRECSARAAAKAEALASALGFELAGVHSVRDEEHAVAPPSHAPCGGFGAPAPARARAASSSLAQELGGLDLLPKKSVTTRVQVE